MKAGSVQCWGANALGQLGDGTHTSHLTPVPVKGLKGVVALTAGGAFTCALTKSGGVKCWGANTAFQLGRGGISDSLTPLDVTGLKSGIIAVAAGLTHACALTKAGGVKCWGSNSHGQLGDGTTNTGTTPVNVKGLKRGVVAIAAGGQAVSQEHTCALTKAGGALCWGYNIDGELGDGTTTERHTPVKVKSF
jgi:alpha-tubulin suppressor-like RCC1 family protein